LFPRFVKDLWFDIFAVVVAVVVRIPLSSHSGQWPTTGTDLDGELHVSGDSRLVVESIFHSIASVGEHGASDCSFPSSTGYCCHFEFAFGRPLGGSWKAGLELAVIPKTIDFT
jgi:hypothetical protein